MTDIEQRRATQLLTPGVILHRMKGGAYYSGCFGSKEVVISRESHEEPLDCGSRILGFRTIRTSRQRVSP